MMEPGVSEPMAVTVNGKAVEMQSDSTVADLLESMGLAPVRVAVEINEELVPRRTFSETIVRSQDCIEIVTFVGGG